MNLLIRLKDSTKAFVEHTTYDNPSVRDIKRCIDRKVGKGQWKEVYFGNWTYMTPNYDIKNVFGDKYKEVA